MHEYQILEKKKKKTKRTNKAANAFTNNSHANESIYELNTHRQSNSQTKRSKYANSLAFGQQLFRRKKNQHNEMVIADETVVRFELNAIALSDT